MKISTVLSGLVGSLTAIVSVAYIILLTSSPASIISPLAQAKTIRPTPSPQQRALNILVNQHFDNFDGSYAVVIKNATTGEFINVNEHHSFEPASLYKLWIMATVMDYINNGKLSEDEEIQDSVEAINAAYKLQPEFAELTEGFVTFTVTDALTQMITISHNYAALLLGKSVRLTNVQKLLKDIGLSESTIGNPPQTTAHDTALFFEKLYKQQLVSSEYSNKMLDLLTKQQLRNKLPKYFPKDTIIAHKTGELGTFSHDAGIVYHPHGDYIIVVLTQSPKPSITEESIALFSKKVYEYFSTSKIHL